MSSEQVQSEIAEIVRQMDSEDDPRACLATIKSRIEDYRGAGRPVPEHLLKLERSLTTELIAQSQGR